MDQNDQQRASEPLDLDDILPQVGEFGRYQKLMLWFVCLPACFPCGFSAFNQLFMVATPEHWCRTSILTNLTRDQRRNLTIPRLNNTTTTTTTTFSRCVRYAVNWTEILKDYNNRIGDDYDNVIVDESWPQEPCLEGWEFDLKDDDIISSIVIDFELVCDKDIYPTLGLVALNLGGPIGVYYFGRLNDKIGRKKSFFLCLTTLLFGNIVTACAQNFWWWAGSRVIVGLTVPAVYQIPFIISLEIVGPNYRSFVTVMSTIFYILGLMMLSGVTYLIRNWVYLTLATSLPFTLYYIYWFFIPESPRWLLAKGEFEEASKILETLARGNNKELPSSFKQQLKQRMLTKTRSEDEEMKKTYNCTVLCTSPNMRLKTLLITFSWFANETVYVGLSYYGPALGNNEYLSFLLSSVVEIPSCIMCWLVMDRWGRRWPLCLCMILSGMTCIATVTLPDDAITATLILFLISKSAISASFLIIYPFAGELYPTQLRGVGIGLSAYVGGLGLIIIPFINHLGSDNLILPLIIMGVLSMLGGLSGLRLPETLHYNLPQTIEEGEQFGKDFSKEDCLRCIPLKPSSKSSLDEDVEMETLRSDADETTPLERSASRRISIRRLARQSSVMETAKDVDGTMKMTYWF